MRIFRTSFMRSLRHRWPRIKKVLPWLILAVVACLLFYFGRSVDWPQVWLAMRRIPRESVLIAAGLVASGYLIYGSLDLLGRRYTGHKLPWPTVLGVAMVSYALNLSLGVLVGGLGARLRLYAKLGCRKAIATRVALFSAASNWIGYGWVAGVVFVSGAIPVPSGWDIGSGLLRGIGAVLLAAVASYVWLCARSKRRSATWLGQKIHLPRGRMALLQSLIGALSWMCMGAVAWVLLQGKAPYPVVLGILLCSSFAAVLTRVPGGLGTTEAIFVAVLSPPLPATEVLGAALAYRAFYALTPLCLALLAFPIAEALLAWRKRQSPQPLQPTDKLTL
ncbi:lysylphosphatidylglycerol synthase domain-containing protein [Achromobacter seleniivolatilans]|uniref:Lysylphosphatidylglycerol synthase domain-containing protein n=1 Tax=Achromobacter seleniivolatilans TaxID=3047478 RepID=A0ABY9M5B7_9BURK|nr:lysylphosphatidylglycerol synthase domain-containing protein [Achromobacter sp. R39]WMD22207.1 lysylphosphatidylglycerol synthase domain-containing protein [Achromobacter sp. R39]